MKNKFISNKQKNKILTYVQLLQNTMYISNIVYDSLFINFINKLMKHGNKASVFLKFFDSLVIIKNITRISPLYILRTALFNVKPLINIKTISRGKRMVFEPSFCSVKTQLQKSISFIINNSSTFKSSNVSLSQRLALSILNCFFKQGDSYLSVLKTHVQLRNKRFNFLKSINLNQLVHIKRTKKMKGYYHQNRNSLFRRLQFLKHV